MLIIHDMHALFVKKRFREIEETYAEARHSENLHVRFWYEFFGFGIDPFGDLFLEAYDNTWDNLDWIVGLKEEGKDFARLLAFSERGVAGICPIVGASFSGRKTLVRAVCKLLEKDCLLRELSEDHSPGAVNIILGDTYAWSTKAPEKGIEFVVLTTTEYWELERDLRDDVVDTIWVRPLSSTEIASTIQTRTRMFSKRKKDAKDLIEEGALREVCKYSHGLPGVAMRIIRSAFLHSFRKGSKLVTESIVKKTVEAEGHAVVRKEYRGLSDAIKRVARVLVAMGSAETLDLVDRVNATFGVRRHRSVVSRHLNHLVGLRLARRTEVGRAAKYEPTPALRVAVDLDNYPE